MAVTQATICVLAVCVLLALVVPFGHTQDVARAQRGLTRRLERMPAKDVPFGPASNIIRMEQTVVAGELPRCLLLAPPPPGVFVLLTSRSYQRPHKRAYRAFHRPHQWAHRTYGPLYWAYWTYWAYWACCYTHACAWRRQLNELRHA